MAVMLIIVLFALAILAVVFRQGVFSGAPQNNWYGYVVGVFFLAPAIAICLAWFGSLFTLPSDKGSFLIMDGFTGMLIGLGVGFLIGLILTFIPSYQRLSRISAFVYYSQIVFVLMTAIVLSVGSDKISNALGNWQDKISQACISVRNEIHMLLDKDFKVQFRVVDVVGDPVPNQRYRITLSTGEVFEGVTDAEGNTLLITRKTPGEAQLELLY